ncbi:MAG TPA: hypothetical protein VN962_00800, partial [Polyangia bacterium]|nr:hypothetical protein [Polyangia bacterium]
FLSKQELKAKLEPLNEMHRALFEPLWQSAIRPAQSTPRSRARLVPAPGPTRPSLEPAARAAAMVPPASPTIPSFEPPSSEAFAGAVLVPPPAPPPRSEPPHQASGIIELKEVEVTFDESAPHRGGPA